MADYREPELFDGPSEAFSSIERSFDRYSKVDERDVLVRYGLFEKGRLVEVVELVRHGGGEQWGVSSVEDCKR